MDRDQAPHRPQTRRMFLRLGEGKGLQEEAGGRRQVGEDPLCLAHIFWEVKTARQVSGL